MPLPRKPRPKLHPRGTRSSRRREHKKTWLAAKLLERFTALGAQLEERRKHTYRGAYGIISYFMPGEPIPPGYEKVEFDEDGEEIAAPVKEKAPDLAAEGFSSFFRERQEPSG